MVTHSPPVRYSLLLKQVRSHDCPPATACLPLTTCYCLHLITCYCLLLTTCNCLHLITCYCLLLTTCYCLPLTTCYCLHLTTCYLLLPAPDHLTTCYCLHLTPCYCLLAPDHLTCCWRHLPACQAGVVSCIAFTGGAGMPLLAGAFLSDEVQRMIAIVTVSTVGLIGFGLLGSILGGAKVGRAAGFRVKGLGCRVQGFRVWVSGFRGLGFGSQGLGV